MITLRDPLTGRVLAQVEALHSCPHCGLLQDAPPTAPQILPRQCLSSAAVGLAQAADNLRGRRVGRHSGSSQAGCQLEASAAGDLCDSRRRIGRQPDALRELLGGAVIRARADALHPQLLATSAPAAAAASAGSPTLCGSSLVGAVSFSATLSKMAATLTAVFAEDSTYSMPLLCSHITV